MPGGAENWRLVFLRPFFRGLDFFLDSTLRTPMKQSGPCNRDNVHGN